MDIDTRAFSIPVRRSVELRFIQSEEAGALYALVDKNRAYLEKWLPWVPEQKGQADSLENIRKRIERAQAGEMLDLGIYRDGELIGSIGLSASIKRPPSVIGYRRSSKGREL